LKALFKAYKDMVCSIGKGHKRRFFSSQAWEMVQRLLDLALHGLLSDPPGISLYFLMGHDRDGLPLYRTIRGTSSTEGGVHMAIRRVFGSLQASPELAEALLLNWILRHNKKVVLTSHTLINSFISHLRLATKTGQESNTMDIMTYGLQMRLWR
jgi:hypothetical protein